MKTHETPAASGHYWALLERPLNMPPREDWASTEPEVVQVWVNDNADAEESLVVSVPGIPRSQPLAAFRWLSGALTPPTEQ